MTSRALLVLVVAVCSIAPIGAAPAGVSGDLRPLAYYLGRADPRLCPSPMCGGIWLRAVNGASGACARPVGGECYVADLAFDGPVGQVATSRLTRLVTQRGGLVLGRKTPAGIDGFPELRALLVAGVWRPASGQQPGGAFRLLRDNGIRCVKAPCFSITARVLNTGSKATVSAVDLKSAGAGREEMRRARKLLATRQLLAAGQIVRTADGGRTFVATQVYFRTYES